MNRKLPYTDLRIAGILALIYLLALAPIATRASSPSSDTLRIALIRYYSAVKQISVAGSAGVTITKTGTDDRVTSSTDSATIALAGEALGITLKRESGDSANVGTSVTVSPAEASGLVTIISPGRPSRKYRGSVEVNLKSGALQLVNVIGVDDYLLGTVPSEMPSHFPVEALKAQTVAARTYALNGKGRHSALGCDLCDGTHCQVYGGALSEKPACTQAVLDTRGLVLTYNNKLADALYCADCGGVTQSYCDSYPGHDICYLRSVTEPEGTVHSSWEKSYKLNELAGKLAKAGVKEAAGLHSIKVTKMATSGRAMAIEITGASGSKEITGSKLRNLMPTDIRSTLFTIALAADGTVTFKGKGWGHGIGLCQIGAKCLAAEPFHYTCNQILAHYYPGTSISQRSPASVALAPPPAKKQARPDEAIAAEPSADTEANAVAAHTPELAPKTGAGPPSQRGEDHPCKPAQPAEDKNDSGEFHVRVKAPSL